MLAQRLQRITHHIPLAQKVKVMLKHDPSSCAVCLSSSASPFASVADAAGTATATLRAMISPERYAFDRRSLANEDASTLNVAVHVLDGEDIFM